MKCKHCGKDIRKGQNARGYTSYTHTGGEFGEHFCNQKGLPKEGIFTDKSKAVN